MGNSQTKEARGADSGQHENGPVASSHRAHHSESQSSQRAHPPRRGSRPDFSSLLGIGSNEPDVASLEARRESKAEREQRKQEKEKQARLKERERSMREEHVDGGYLVTQGVYVGAEDYNKTTVRQLMIERRLAPFWRGLDDFSKTWAEHQIMAAARGMPIPPADQVPPELEYSLSKRPSQDAGKSLAIPAGQRSESYQSDSGRASPANASYGFPGTSPQPNVSSSLPFRSRAKTLASLGSASRSNSEKDLSPRELRLPHDPFVNGQPIEVFLYKEPLECPICCLDYPPYLNLTRCCEQAICSECFVQIKRPDPHAPEHTEPDPNAPPMSEEERQAQAEGLLVSEVATCPFCKLPEFGVTYNAPPFKRGLTYNSPYGITSARSSQNSVASASLSPGIGRRRGTSLSVNAPEVITTDKIRPDWASKLATARAHAARRSAAASALHAAAYLMNDQAQRPSGGPFGRRSMLRRPTLENSERPSDAQLSALSFLAERQSAYNAGDPSAATAHRGSGTRRSRMDDLEDMMMMEAIRLSLAAEEERRRKEEKEAKKKAKKEEKEQKRADKSARKTGSSLIPGYDEFAPINYTNSNGSSTHGDNVGKGKNAERGESPPPRLQADGLDFASDGAGSSFMGTSQESLTSPMAIPSAAEPFKRSHLRQMSNASSASSSFHEPGSSTPPVSEPMFNFQSLAAMIDKDEKQNGGSHVEHAEDSKEGTSRDLQDPSQHDQRENDMHKDGHHATISMQTEPVNGLSR